MNKLIIRLYTKKEIQNSKINIAVNNGLNGNVIFKIIAIIILINN